MTLGLTFPWIDERQALHSIMKDLVALQMTRRQPMPAYDMAKAKPANTVGTANRQVTHTYTRTQRKMKICLTSVWTCSHTALFISSRTTSESSLNSAEREGECAEPELGYAMYLIPLCTIIMYTCTQKSTDDLSSTQTHAQTFPSSARSLEFERKRKRLWFVYRCQEKPQIC